MALTCQLLLHGHGSGIVRAIKCPYEMKSFQAHVRYSNPNALSPLYHFTSEHVFYSLYVAFLANRQNGREITLYG